MDKKFLIFGTSISWGAWDPEGGWADALKRHVSNKVIDTGGEFWALVYNQSVSGEASSDLVKRFTNEIDARIQPTQEVIIIFETGINDSQYLNHENKFRVSLLTFSQNLNQLIPMAKKYTPHINFLSAPPVIDEILDPIPRHPEHTYQSAYVAKFNQITKDLCQKENLSFIDIFSLFKAGDMKTLMSPDGYHPSRAGHQLIFNTVLDKLQPHLK